jgi:competence protein ComEC
MLAYLRAVAPALTTIDHLILSHPHRDHVELLPDLFGAYQIAQV